MSVLDDLQRVRAEQVELERRRAKREADRDAAKARLRENTKKLKAEFGVTSLEAGRAKLDVMEAAVREDMQALREKIREATGE